MIDINFILLYNIQQEHNSPMTYKELLEKLQALNEEQLNSNVTVYDIGAGTFEEIDNTGFSNSVGDEQKDTDRFYIEVGN